MKIKYKDLKICFLLLPLILGRVHFFLVNPYAKYFLYAYSILTSIYIFAEYIYRNKLEKLVLLVIIFLTVTLISSVLNRNLPIGFLVISIPSLIGALMLIQMYGKQALIALYYLVSIFIVLNFLSIFFGDSLHRLATQGTYPILLGAKNRLPIVLLPWATIIVLQMQLRATKVRFENRKNRDLIDILLICLCFIPNIIARGGTGMILVFAYLLFCMFYKIIKIKYRFLIDTCILGWGLLMLFTFFSFDIKLANYNFLSFLGKRLSFTGRTIIWRNYIDKIMENPLFGFGEGLMLYIPEFEKPFQTHNAFLEVLSHSGIIGFLLFLSILFKCSKSAKYMQKSVSYKFLSFTIFLLLIVGLMESVSYYTELYVLMGFLNCLDSLYFPTIVKYKNCILYNRRKHEDIVSIYPNV